jgi:hypothetical protein
VVTTAEGFVSDSAAAVVGSAVVGSAAVGSAAVVSAAVAGAAVVGAGASAGAAVLVAGVDCAVADGAALVVGAALVGVVVCWLCWVAELLDVAADDAADDEPEGASEDGVVDESVPEVALVLDSGDVVVEVVADVEGVVDSLSDGALGVEVGGARAGTNSADDGGTV